MYQLLLLQRTHLSNVIMTGSSTTLKNREKEASSRNIAVYCTPDLFFSNSHVVLHFSKNGWLDEITPLCSRAAATKQFGTFLLSSIDVSKDLLILSLIYLKDQRNEWKSV